MKLNTKEVKEILEGRGMTISDLADALGVRPQGIWSMLNGSGRVSLRTVGRVAGALGVPGKDLIVDDDDLAA